MAFWNKIFWKKASREDDTEQYAKSITPIVLPTQQDELIVEKITPDIKTEEVEEMLVVTDERNAIEEVAEETTNLKIEQTTDELVEEENITQHEEYSFQFAMTDEDIRNRVIEFIKPITNERDIINLQLAYGVLETKTKIFIIHTKNEQKWDEDTGARYDTTYFAAVIEDAVISISYTVKDSQDVGEATYEVPEEYANVLTLALEYWRNWDEHKKYENEYDRLHKEQSMLGLIAAYKKTLYKLVPKKKPAVKESYEINSLEDAKKLFYLCDKDIYRKMKEMCDDATIEAFNKYADKDQQVKWIVEDCEAVLNEIIAGNTDKLYKKLRFISGNCGYWFSDPNDLAESYYKACEVMFNTDVYVPLQCIDSYLSFYEIRFNPLHAIPILDLTERYLKEKYSEEYQTRDSSSDVFKLKRRCASIRCKVSEISPIDNIYQFEFALIKPEILDVILSWYYKKYNDIEAVKEILTEFNCVYGVQNDDIFLTAMTDAAEEANSSSFYRREYIVVDLKSKEVVDFECKQSAEDGSYCVEGHFPEHLLEVTMNAVAFFRNKPEREAFFEDYANNHNGEKVYYTKDKARKKWFSGLGKTFQKLLKRIGDNPLSDTLKQFVELCEVIAPEYGYKNVVVNKPATEAAIDKWEQKNGIHLPDSYRYFLRFANGCQLGTATERIAGLDEIVLSNEYIEPAYMIIGSIIGDGTTLCMEKSTGKAYIEDHGEYQCVGEFKELLEYVMDMH